MYTKHCVANRFAPNGFENLARLEVKTADFDQSEKWILSILSLLCLFFYPVSHVYRVSSQSPKQIQNVKMGPLPPEALLFGDVGS